MTHVKADPGKSLMDAQNNDLLPAPLSGKQVPQPQYPSTRSERARYAVLAAICGILSPFGWIPGIISPAIWAMGSAKPKPSGGDVAILFLLFGLFTLSPAVLAVLAGKAARRRIRESGGVLSGKGLALTGLIMGLGTLIVFAILTLGVALMAMFAPEQIDEFLRKEGERGP